MSVTLFTGPINSGKSRRCLELLNQSDPGLTGTIVTPDRASAAALRRRLLAMSKGRRTAIRADAVQDWHGFIRTLAAPMLPTASRRHSTLIVLGLFERLSLPYFGKSSRSYATAEGFSRTILLLKENLIRPDELLSLIETTGDACLRERDLATVYGAYDAELSRLGLLDEGDLSLLALKNALEGKAPLAGLKLLAFDEFVMPTPLQVAMLRSLSQGLKKTAIFATCPAATASEEGPFVAYLQQARAAWLAACDDEEQLPAPKAVAPRVRVARCATPAQEARHVASMVADAGLAAEEIVVASRPGDSFLEWFLSEAHSMGTLPEHPTLDGASGSPLFHELLSPATIEGLPEKAALPAFVAKLRQLAAVNERVRPWIAGLKERRGHGRVAARSLTAAEVVESAFRELDAAAGWMGALTLTREQFAQLLGDALRDSSASASMLASVLPFRHHALGAPIACESRRLICPRMIEGSFPGRAVESLFFADWQEESIRRIFPDAAQAHARDAFAFETLLCTCRGPITLLLPATTDSGGETIPSPFVDRFLADGEEPEALPTVVLDRTAAGRALQALQPLAAIEAARRAGEAPQESRHAPHLGVLRSPEALALLRERYGSAELSASALERYAKCPFTFLARDVLHIAEPTEETPQLQPSHRGTLLHDVLAGFYRDHLDEALALRAKAEVPERTRGLLQRIAEAAWQGQRDRLAYVDPALREREVAEVVQMALCVIATEAEEAAAISSPLIPAACEWEFGAKQGNALEIPVQGEAPLRVCGRIDRVDLDGDRSRFLVIDYKSGREEQVPGRIERGKHLQLPLYVRAAQRGLFPEALPLGALFIEVKEIGPAGEGKRTEGKNKGLVLKEFNDACYRLGGSHSKVSGERFEALMQSAETHAAAHAVAIRRGIFPATDGTECRNCDYADSCRHQKISAD